MSQEDLVSRMLNLNIPIIIMPVDNKKSTHKINNLMLDHPGNHTNERYIIHYRSDINHDTKTNDLNKLNGFKSKHRLDKSINGCSATLDKKLIPQLMDDPDILYLEKDEVMYDMTYFKTPIDDTQVNALQQLWHQTMTNISISSTDNFSTVHCYILDSGILPNHSEFSTGQIKLDYNAISENNQAQDDNGHGTGVASIVGGKSVGIAPKVILHSIKVLNSTGNGYTSDKIDGLNWILLNKKMPCIINISLGGTFSSSLNTAVQNCLNNGIQVVMASGNSGIDAINTSPCNVTGGITVSAYDQTKKKPTWSNFGTVIDTFAPGELLKSAWGDSPTSYFNVSGTSFSAPIVTGIICRYLKEKPNATPADILTFLSRSNIANEIINPGSTTTPNLRLVWNPAKIQPC